MKTSQIKSLAGASVLSLFLTGCVQASGGVELPPASVVSANKLGNIYTGSFPFLAVTADGRKALGFGKAKFVYSDDGLETFKEIAPNIVITKSMVTAYQNKFYAVKKDTADYYSSTDGKNWSKEGVIAPYHNGDGWHTLFSEKADSLGFINIKTGERKYIKNPPKDIINTPLDKKNRKYLTRGDDLVIAYNANKYDGISISYDKGKTWEHLDNLFPQYKYNNTHDGYVHVTYHNKVFYLWFAPLDSPNSPGKGYYTTPNGKNWESHRNELKNIQYILPINQGLLLFYFDEIDKFLVVENITQSAKQKIPNIRCLYRATYFPQAKGVVLSGINNNGNPFLHILPTEGVLTGSGIVDFQCNKQFLAARFGNGLQVLVTPFLGSISAYPFVDEPFSITDSLSGSTTLKIGRWF